MPGPNTMAVIWIAAIVVFLIVEGVTVGLTSIWFACGALAALVMELLHLSIWTQLAVFLIVSAAAIWFTRPLVKRHNAKRAATNADRVLGQTGLTVSCIDNLEATGLVHVDGKDWSARSASGETVEAGTEVTVLRIEGVKLIVEPVRSGPDQRKEN